MTGNRTDCILFIPRPMAALLVRRLYPGSTSATLSVVLDAGAVKESFAMWSGNRELYPSTSYDHVCFWPKADPTVCDSDVRFQGLERTSVWTRRTPQMTLSRHFP